MKITMEEKARKTILCVLRSIKYKSDLSPDTTEDQDKLKEKVFERIISEKKSSGIVESSKRQRNRYFDLIVGKRVDLFYKNVSYCGIEFVELEGILGKLKQEGILKDFIFKFDLPKNGRFELILPEKFNSKIQTYEEKYNSYRKSLGQKKSEQATDDPLSIQLKKHKLIINENTGNVSLNKIKTNLNPESKEFRILLKLATSKDYKATYEDFLGDKPTTVNKRNLAFSIRNIKEALGILPKKNALNENIIKNIKNHGYRLMN